MRLIPIESLDDVRVAHYRDLKDHELASGGDLFIAEGAHLVERLIASRYPVESVLGSSKRLEKMRGAIDQLGDEPVYVAPHELVSRVVGFKFHSGVIAVGRRLPGETLEGLCTGAGLDNRLLLLVCPEVINHDNLGSLMRIAAAFGVDGLVLGPRSCDPFWRRAVRVSMGAVFSLRIVRSNNMLSDLALMRERYNVRHVATVLDESARPLAGVKGIKRMALWMGSESQGLDSQVVAACDARVTLPMRLGTDSLNITIATAVFLYHFTHVSGPG
ncbi:MAG: hypothetical protein GC164_12850 [Phycisphaera sp.]|nr:hypothetical protein [Phycisphaera sp.]